MSHELRTPLNIIAGYVELLREGVLGAIEAKQVEALDKVARQSRELLTMINGILDVTKIEGGAMVMERNEVDLARLFDEIRPTMGCPSEKRLKLFGAALRNCR